MINQKNKKIILVMFLLILINIIFPQNLFAITEPEINSEAALLIENKSGNILYEKNSTKKMYPASTTKIMTAIITIENCDLNDKVKVSQNAIDLVPSGYTTAKLVVGETMTVEDLLYGLMLNSANEAANVLAEHISGSIDDFAILMTQKAQELGCTNTNFLNANGMHDDNHYTTAKDLAIITKYCMQNETFRKIVSTVEYPLPATTQYPKNDRIMSNTNALINPTSQYYNKNVIGVKTGYTKQAGNCLVSFAEKNGIELICITLNAESSNSKSYRFEDSNKLLEYGYNNFSYQTIIKRNTIIDTIEIENATKDSKNLNIIIEDTISDYIANDYKNTNFKKTIKINNDLKAPINSGDKIGTISYTLNNKIYESDLIAESAVYTTHNYGQYALLIGLIILIISIIIVPKKKKINN